MNNAILPQLVQLHQKNFFVSPLHIPGSENTRADYFSRKPDAKNYRLDPAVFARMCQAHRYQPTLDLFANARNRQTRDFCSWRANLRSRGNAFNQDWSRTLNWLNPPWDIIHRSLWKLRSDGATALRCLPEWKTAPWWHLFREMMVGAPTVVSREALFRDPSGRVMPPPRWPTLFVVLDGNQVHV